MDGQIGPSDLTRSRYFLTKRAMDLFVDGKRRLTMLHEAKNCGAFYVRGSVVAEIGRGQARQVAKETRTFLCLRCGPMK